MNFEINGLLCLTLFETNNSWFTLAFIRVLWPICHEFCAPLTAVVIVCCRHLQFSHFWLLGLWHPNRMGV